MPDERVLLGGERAAPEGLGAKQRASRAQLQQAPTTEEDRSDAASAGVAERQRWRTIVAVLLIVLGCVLAPLAGVAVWARNQVTNASGVQGFTHDQIAKIVASDAFAEAWVQANRAAHAELVSALTGKGGNGAVTVKDDTVSVNLAPFIQTIKAQLVDSGFSLAAKIPEVNTSFVVFQSADITRARRAF